ncbi:hypothetical protein IMCC3317_27820 [Kordia antarctica]|uniref:Uncharacterized protein n=1 Tax=Kordia antarctica TaxID=1218801 RepID=A0A7L4ZL09_9FLAO|nr:hypothetical protein [Kordia antarctica]QHI37403.1 hypothetical protein IMCC3317_27820 [Kordia antarctica]
MKQTITKSNKNVEILNLLIANGFYNGYVRTEKFELMRNRFPNNHRIIGIANDTGNYELKFDFKPPMNIIAKFLLALGILVSIISLIKGNWVIPVVLVVYGLIVVIDFKLKEKKEINILTDKLLEFHKTEPN